ncbi:helix-turn-helix domain-containing protein [Acinetobacter sp. ANC 4648]|uniref:helix-turn-helix domain-containing protein n=1 Tax=Acinetobacter sp. ANC 4648 TaxID=1977875 RepID=UPI000A332BFC|nr:AraC family transcriptional regulator [Acinetobacter sp. ANC 4648]OTG82983.1 AraC family transcriptional regulator [Acinetobacter sp. ANC 4648]
MKRSILGLMYLIHGMRNSGIDVDTRLASIGINADALDPSSIIHPSLEWDIQKVIGEGVKPEVGLFIGQHYALAGYGPLLMLLVTCSTIQDALKYGIQFQGLTHLFGRLGLVYSNNHVALTYEPIDLNTEMGLLRAQCEVSGTYKFLQDIYKMMGLVAPTIRVELPFKPPQELDVLNQYKTYYGSDLHFGAEKAAFQLNDVVMNVRIPSADPITFRVYEAKCIAEIERLNAEETDQASLIQRVRGYLELQQGNIPSMATTAQALNIPERTLRYQLQQLNSSYKQIREQLIKHKALRLIEYNEYSIEVIAELLGYSEPAAFNHAFKRWFGQSPRQYGK